MSKNILSIKNLNISFETQKGFFSAVKDISFEVRRNSITGIVGESGCGKSLTSISVIGLLPENAVTEGRIKFMDEEILPYNEKIMRKIRGKEISMIFQEPMTALNPLWKVGRQIDENLKLHTVSDKKERFSRVLEIMNDVGLPDVVNLYHKYPHELSGGMRQRIVIAVAIACRPKLIIADEPTTALDVTIQAQILELLKEIKVRSGSSMIFISHDLGVVREICDEVCVMYSGYIVEKANTTAIFEKQYHPYTLGLIRSIPTVESKGKTLYVINGKVPSIYDDIPGCPFASRCEYAEKKCEVHLPELREISGNHYVRCAKAGEITWNRR